MFLTQQGGFIVRPISILLGEILNLIYNVLNKIGIVNIGVAIILFTVIIRLCLLPSQFKQNRSTKVMNYIQPEINKVTKKYKNKRDQESLMAQQRETKQIQDKYGISMTSGCLTSLIQLPIFVSLYRVIQNVPAYVDKVYNLYHPIAKSIYSDQAAVEKLTQFHQDTANGLSTVKLNPDNIDTIIDVLAKFSADTWDKFSELFNNQGAVVDAINSNVDKINHVYSFVGGINLTSAPTLLSIAVIIPILSMVFQFLSMHATPQQNSSDPTQQASMKTMRMMMNIMPIMSFFVCLNVPSGVGLYWATGSLISFVTTVIINSYFRHADMDKIVDECKERAAKKNDKKKAKGKKSFMEKLQEAAYGEQETQPKVNKDVANTSLKSYTSNTMSSNSGSDVKYRAGSLASKANAMQRYNENNNGGK